MIQVKFVSGSTATRSDRLASSKVSIVGPTPPVSILITMRASLDMRRAMLRGSLRIIIDITDEETGRVISIPPGPVELVFDTLQCTLMDMLDRARDSGATPVVRPEGEGGQPLIPKIKPLNF